MQVCWKWQHATDVVKRIQDLFNLEIALKYLNHAELFSVCQICGSSYWSGVWLSTLFFPDIHWHNIRYDIFIITGTWGPSQLKHLISKVNLNASLRPNITALKKKHESLNFPSHTSKNLMTEKRPFCAVLWGFSLSRKTLIYSLNITH